MVKIVQTDIAQGFSVAIFRIQCCNKVEWLLPCVFEVHFMYQ